MDRNSLNLVRVETEQELTAYFTNEAIWLRFTRKQMERLLNRLKQGDTWSWPEIVRQHSVKKD